MAIFTRQEIERRWAAVRAKFGQAECLVVPSFYNSYYVSGVPVVQWGRWAVTILFRDAEPVLVIPEFESSAAASNSPIRDIRVYRDDDGPSSLRTATEHVIATLARLQPRIIGIEGRGMPQAMARQIADALPYATLLDLTDAIDSVRIVSSKEEIAYLRTATAAADAGIEAVIAAMRPGVPELALCAAAQSAMAAAVPDGVEVQTKCYMQQDERSFLSHAASTRQPIGQHALVEVVCECQVYFYQAAVERAILVGDPPPHVRDGYRTSVAAFEAACAAVRPGNSFAAVHTAAAEVLLAGGCDRITTGSGLVRNVLHHTGGRIEFASFRNGNDRRLEPGMVVTVEPWALIPGVGSPRHCDMILVTAGGQEVLSQARKGLIELHRPASAA